MPKKRSAEGEYRIAGSVLDELGLDRQGALELKLKASLHQKILELVKRRRNKAREYRSRASSSRKIGLAGTTSSGEIKSADIAWIVIGPASTAKYHIPQAWIHQHAA